MENIRLIHKGLEVVNAIQNHITVVVVKKEWRMKNEEENEEERRRKRKKKKKKGKYTCKPISSF